MEGPVLTTPSSHRLRSAVSACAQPPHLFFGSSSYLGAKIQCSAHNSGGCIKKFYRFFKDGEFPIFDKLNSTKKKDSGEGFNDIPKNGCVKSTLVAKSDLNQYCEFGSPFPIRSFQSQAKNHHHGRSFRRSRRHRQNGKNEEVLTGALTEFPEALTAPFTCRNEFLSKPTLNRRGLETKGPKDCLSDDCEADIDGKYDRVIDKNCTSESYNDFCLDGGHGNGCSDCNNASISRGSVKILNCTKNPIRTKKKNNIKKVGGTGGSEKEEGGGGGGGGEGGGRGNLDNSGGILFGKKIGICKEKICDKYSSNNVHEKRYHETKNGKQEIFRRQPKNELTRTALLLRDIRNAWKKKFGTLKPVPAENVQLLFNDLQTCPSVSKVAEMLKCAQERSENPSSKHLTFGEFYKIANDLIRTDCRITSASSPPKVFEKNVEKHRGTFSKGMSRYEVFLGGSCNPTTWRTDLAIPELESMNITYYNPQVEEWRPELLEAEHQAKENATVLFFVVDNQTRGVSALIEVAHLAGKERLLILVIQSYTQEHQIISDEEISQKEYEDLKMGQEVLRDLVQRQRIPVYDDIKTALKSTEKILREGILAQDLRGGGNYSARNEEPMYPREIFDILDEEKVGKIFVWETILALKLLRCRKVSLKRLETLAKASGNSSNGIPFENAKIDFETFTKLIDQFDVQQHQQPQKLTENEMKIKLSSVTNFPSNRCESIWDIYLGGTIENTNWRQNVAIPLLTSENLRYFTPRANFGGNSKITDVEVAAMESTFVLLFVITNTARSIAAMAIAGHYIGRSANVVLCVEHLPEEVRFGNEILTHRAVKDYNRGRMYLMDIAKRSGVPVFDRIADAVACAIEKCKSASAAAEDKNSMSHSNFGD